MVKHLLPLIGLLTITGLQAETVPALVIGSHTSVALQDITSVQFTSSALTVHLTDGTQLLEPLADLTFGTIEAQGIAQLPVDEAASYAVYDQGGRLMKSGRTTASDPLVGLQPGSYILRQGGQSRKVSLCGSAARTCYAASDLSAAVPTRVLATDASAMQICLPGIDPMTDLSTIDCLTFDPDGTLMHVLRSGVSSDFSIADISRITFGALQESVTVVYGEDSVDGISPFHFDGVSLVTEGAGVTVTSTYPTEVEYALSGSSANGYFKIYSSVKWQATLLGLTLTNPVGPAINSQTGKKGTIHLQKGYDNQLCDGATYAESAEDQKGCIFSEGQIIFNGQGSLQVTSLYKHGIVSDDYVSFDNGTVTVLSAVSDAVHAKDSVIFQAGTVTLSPSSDGVDCDGPIFIRQGDNGSPVLSITTTGDGAKGIKTGADFMMSDGTVTITQTGHKKVEDGDTSRVIGIKAAGNIIITGGSVTINNTADGGKDVSADGSIIVSDSAWVSWRQ